MKFHAFLLLVGISTKTTQIYNSRHISQSECYVSWTHANTTSG